MTQTTLWRTLSLIAFVLCWQSQAMADTPTTKPNKAKAATQTMPKALPKATLTKLITCALMNRFNTYQSTQKTMKLGRRRIGMVTGDWDTLLFVYKVRRCVLAVAKKPSSSRLSAIAALAGLPLFAPTQPSQKHSPLLNQYNPALLQWLARHIPKPSEKLAGIPYQTIYQYSLQRLVRLTAYTYLYLQSPKGKKLYQAYARVNAKPEGSAKRHSLEQRLRQKAFRDKVEKQLKHLVRDSSIVGKYIEFNSGEAALFLMRRMMGGSAPALWALLKRILNQYDPGFLPRVTKKKPLGAIDLWVPQKKKYKPSIWDASLVRQVGVFIANAPPYTRIQLRPGVYRINSSWKLKKARHVILEGIGKGKVEIISTAIYDTVLSIENSHDIQIRNLHMRHTKVTGKSTCSGQVIYINDSRRIWIDGNELNGSGTVGVSVIGGNDIVITRNFIHSNTRAGIDLFMTKDIDIMYNRITKNASALLCHKCSFSMGHNTISNNKIATPHRTFSTRILKQIKANRKKK